MASYSAWILTLALCAVPASAVAGTCGHEQAAGPQQGQGQPSAGAERRSRGGPQQDRPWKKWWQDPQDRTELGITEQQSTKIEQIFQDALQQQRPRWQEFEKLEADLNTVIKDGSADPSIVQRQVDRVETLRAELAKTRTMMIYRMHQVLSAEQRAKLQARFDREHRKLSDTAVRR